MLFCIASLYLGPNAAIESLGGDVFAVQVLLSLPDCIVYALTYRSIHLIERRKAGLQSLGIAFVCLLACLPLGGAVEGAGLWGRLGLLFLSRCCVSFYYGILFLYIIELYPEQVRSIGFGTVSAGGALGGIAVQKVASLAEQWDHDPLAYLLIFSLLCLVAAFHLP
jgi:nitrate/nitrite transporter NarK